MRRCKNKLVNHIAPAFTVLFCSHHACAAHTTHNTPEEKFPARRTRPAYPSDRPTCNLGLAGHHFDRTLTDAASTFRLRTGPLAILAFAGHRSDLGLRRTPALCFAFGQACLQPSNFLSHARHQTHHTARHFCIVNTLLLLHDNLHHTKTTHAHLHLLACHIPSGWCWARVVNSPTVPLDQHQHRGTPRMFEATSDGKYIGVRQLRYI